MNYKKEIAKLINEIINIDIDYLDSIIEIPKEISRGDYTLPCYNLMKYIKKDPNIIAKEIKESIDNKYIDRIENIGPYLNFYVKKLNFVEKILTEIIEKGENYGKSNLGEGKTIFLSLLVKDIKNEDQYILERYIKDFLYKLYKKQGYNIISLNNLEEVNTDKIEDIIKKIESKNLIIKGFNDKIVNLHKYNLAPAILYKEDINSYTNIAKEITKIIDNNKIYNFHKYIYINNKSEELYYRQIIKILELLDEKCYKSFININVGRVKIIDQYFFSHISKEISLLKFYKKLENNILAEVESLYSYKEINSYNIEKLCKVVMINTLIENNIELSNDNIRQVKDDIILIIDCLKEEEKENYIYSKIKYNKINTKEELQLVRMLSKFSEIIELATESNNLYVLTSYLLEIAKIFKEINNISTTYKDNELMYSRFILRKATNQVIKNILSFLL